MATPTTPQIHPPTKRRRPGPQLPTDWQTRFLRYYREHGGLWRAAEAAGVSYDTAQSWRQSDPAFGQAVQDAKQSYADSLEQRMIAQAEASGNPVGYIVRLKALRPNEYIEKHAVVNFNLQAEIPGVDVVSVLHTMLGHLTEPTRALLAAPPTHAPVTGEDTDDAPSAPGSEPAP